MREILFRGKAHDGRWVVSRTLWNAKGNIFLRDDTGKWIHVVSETVGQYTGYEVGGQGLFEGDIVQLDYEPAWDESAGEYRYSQTAWGTIVFESGMFLFKEYRGVHNTNPRIERDLFVWELHRMYEGTWLKIEPDKFVNHAKHAEVIGNIFDNPELLEEQ